MGDSLEELNKVEYVSLSERFEKLCPIFMNLGMTYKEFWEEDPTMAKDYLKAFEIKQKREIRNKEWEIWKQGMYVYEALIDVSPILHAFSKAKKPLPYPEKPYGIEEIDEKIEEKDEITKEQEKENERLKATVFFNNWARATRKHFKK